MNIIMSGMDFHTCGLDAREKFHVLESCAGALAGRIKAEYGLLGCVVLSTCNRTEVYINTRDGLDVHPGEMLVRVMTGEDFSQYEKYFIRRSGDEVITYLMEMSAGIHSQIFGDDQIVSQVKNSLGAAREEKAADAYLETLFRNAITAAKRVKTEVRLTTDRTSIADAGVKKLKEFFHGDLKGRRGLVIGNGEMGKLAARSLVKLGAQVTVTIREYKYKPVIVPPGCSTVMYGSRYRDFGEYDFVVSATTSPHFTVTKEDVSPMERLPRVFVDLAVPRDIDPQITQEGAVLYNLDSLGEISQKPDLTEVYKIIDIYRQKFYHWLKYKNLGNGAAE